MIGVTSRKRLQIGFNFLLLAGLVLILARCGNNSGPASGTFGNVYQNTLSKECVQCHQPGSSQGFNAGTHLDFSTQAQAYATLTSGSTSKVSSTDAATGCPGVAIVVASNPSASYLTATLFSDQAAKYQSSPAGCTSPYNHITTQNINLSTDEENSIVTWIQNGAQNN
jgi:hypothetical protein